MSTDKTNQSWGGRFSEPVDAFVARFTASVTFDQRLYRHDIMGSIAHATMLAKVGVLTDAERDSIIDGLTTIRGEIEAGTFDWRVDLEDVHMNIEARLTDRIGVTGKKLHTGRSRNDQVATDIRLWLRDEIDLILAEITRLQKGLLEQAERESDTIMPGFTHLQTAQPVTFVAAGRPVSTRPGAGVLQGNRAVHRAARARLFRRGVLRYAGAGCDQGKIQGRVAVGDRVFRSTRQVRALRGGGELHDCRSVFHVQREPRLWRGREAVWRGSAG
jgi:hypothetical protein